MFLDLGKEIISLNDLISIRLSDVEPTHLIIKTKCNCKRLVFVSVDARNLFYDELKESLFFVEALRQADQLIECKEVAVYE